MAPGFEPDASGRLRETEPSDVRRGPWTVRLAVQQSLCSARGRYAWAVDGRPIRPTRTIGCLYDTSFRHQGVHTVRLTVRLNGLTLTDTQTIRVRDLLIVSIGDSVGSGEAVPDVPGLNRAEWNSARCHRSGRASPAKAAARIEADDPHTSVTFVHLACSGAGIETGLLHGYEGAEPPRSEPNLPPQLDQLRQVAERRPIDALIVNAGANDAHFADVVKRCGQPSSVSCFDRRFNPGDPATTAAVVQSSLDRLPRLYARLVRRLRPLVPRARVHIVQYFDPTTGRDGRSCAHSLGFTTAADLTRARANLLRPLNDDIAATSRFGWDVVTGAAQAFRGHGYCAGDQSWVRRVEESVFTQGGERQSPILGTFHPNEAGQRAIAGLVAPHIERSVFGHVVAQPAAAEHAEPGSGERSILATVIAALASAFSIAAVGWLAWRHRKALERTGLVLLVVGGGVLLYLACHLDLSDRSAREAAGLGGTVLGAGLLLAAWMWGRHHPVKPHHRRWLALASVAVVAAALLAGLGIWGGLRGWLLGAGLVGGTVLATVVRGHTAADPPSLPRTLVPVLLPLLAILAVGSVTLAAWVPPIMGLLVAFVAGHAMVRPELRRDERELEWVLEMGRQLAALAVAVGLLAGAVSRWVQPDGASFENRGVISIGLLVAAMVLVLVTIVLRLVSYATTILRAVVAVALGYLVVRGLMQVGVVPGFNFWRDHAPAADDALVLLCAIVTICALVAEIVARRRGVDLVPRLRRRFEDVSFSTKAAGTGLGTALLAAVVVGSSAVASMIETTDTSDVKPAPAAAAQQPDPVVPADDDVLAETYAPVLAFAAHERWTPIPVDDYLGPDAHLLGPDGANEPARTLADLRRTCPGGPQDACWHVTIDCPHGGDPCARGHEDPRTFVRDGAAYVRVLRSSRPNVDGAGAVFASVPPRLRAMGLSTLVQYWFFYRYDEWRAPIPAGTLAQRHEGDWEAVMVGLAPARPLFVAYSAHCGGHWLPWDRIRVSPISTPRTHPLVAVAEGSHANYPRAGPQTPNWESCTGMPAGAADVLTYAANVRERTDYDRQWYPDRLIQARADRLPMSFPGTWGQNDRSVLENFAHHRTSKSGGGPKSPPLQPLWADPVRTVFCNRYWKGTASLCRGG